MNRQKLFNDIYVCVIILSIFEFCLGIYEAYILSKNPIDYKFTTSQEISYIFIFYKCVLNNICAFTNLIGLCCILYCSFNELIIICLSRLGQFLLTIHGFIICFTNIMDDLEPFSIAIVIELWLSCATVIIFMCKFIQINYLE